MGSIIAIVEGNHEGLVSTKNGKPYGAAERFAACLSRLDSSLSFTFVRPHFSDYQSNKEVFSGCDGIVFTGSANHWSADDAPASLAREVMGCALASKRPVFGSCYGLQLAVAVLGGVNQANPVATEFAIAKDIRVNEAGANHRLYQNKPRRFDARAMHRDEVLRLPKGAICLASNSHSTYQGVVYEKEGIRFWGVQYHPELCFGDVAHYIETNDVASFADAKGFAAELGLSCDLPEIISDFRSLDSKVPALQKKYHLSQSLIDDDIHNCELRNFLSSI